MGYQTPKISNNFSMKNLILYIGILLDPRDNCGCIIHPVLPKIQSGLCLDSKIVRRTSPLWIT